MKKFIILVIFILSNYGGFAQEFKWQTTLPKVEKNGFYSIILSPDITSRLRSDMADIRLYHHQSEIPYLFQQEKAIDEKLLFREYKILSNEVVKNCCTILTLQGDTDQSINNISLMIRNADVRKKARLSGSDDQENWYVIRDKYQIESIYSQKQTYEVRVLDFPLSNYAFYRLEISDSTSSPLQILQAGYYDTEAEKGKYLQIENVKVVRQDSTDKQSYLWISYPSPQVIDKISFTIDQPALYFRNAKVCRIRYDKRNRKHLEPVQYIELRSNQEREYNIQLMEKEFCIVIDNQDNPPLTISGFQAFQLTRYITASLKAGETYHIKFGDPDLRRPNYDLMYYKDSIPDQTQMVKTLNITPIAAVVEPPQDSLFTSRNWIWLAIILVISLLGYMSWRMIGDMKGKE